MYAIDETVLIDSTVPFFFMSITTARRVRCTTTDDDACEKSFYLPSAAAPPSVAPEPCAEVAQDCCQGGCPIDKDATAEARLEPTAPEDWPPETAKDVLENETEIVVEGKSAKKPRKTAKKNETDEARPPKLPNAYMLFYQDGLKKDAYVGIALPERAKMIGALWRQMDGSARAPVQKRVAKAKEALTA